MIFNALSVLAALAAVSQVCAQDTNDCTQGCIRKALAGNPCNSV